MLLNAPDSEKDYIYKIEAITYCAETIRDESAIFYNFRISLFPTNMFCQTEIKIFSLHKGNFLSLNITSTGFNV